MLSSDLCLSELVIMVRESEIESSSVDIQRFSLYTAGHDRALNVPAWSSLQHKKYLYSNHRPLGVPARSSLQH